MSVAEQTANKTADGTAKIEQSATVAVPQPQVEQRDEFQLRELSAQQLIAGASVWMAAAAALTFVVTSIGTILIWRQVKLTRQAVKDTSEATLAMREANAIATKANEDSLRAWLFMDTLRYEPRQERNENWWDLCVVVKNFGQSPAIGTVINISWQVTTMPGESIDHIVAEWPEPKEAGIIAPGSVALSKHIPLTEQQILEQWISLICEVKYTDAITGTPRETRFRIVAKAVNASHNQFAMRWSFVGNVNAV